MSKVLRSTLAAVLALLVLTSAALAAAQRTPLNGTEHRFFGPPGRVWTAGPWTQLRDIPFTGTFDFGALAGSETQLINAKLDTVNGTAQVWGVVTYTDAASGVVCSGLLEGKVTNFLGTFIIVAKCSNGALLRGTLQDTAANPGVDATSTFEGELLMP
jgi:hypothetical protein